MSKDTETKPAEIQEIELNEVVGGLLRDDWTTDFGGVGKRTGAVQLLDLHNE